MNVDTPEPEPDAIPNATPAHLLAVQELLQVGMVLVRLVQKQAEIEVEAAATLNEPAPDFTIAYERMSRAIRRTALVIERLLQPVKARAAAPALDRRIAARKQIIRAVEDSITRDAPPAIADDLQAEFMERMDSPEIDDEIGDRPTLDIIAEVKRDLGIGGPPGAEPAWKRRTPQDVALLCARAAIPRPAAGPFVLPMPPRTWTPARPLFAAGEMRAAPDEGRIRRPQ